MARKPFLPKYAGAPWALGVGCANGRPEMMKLIAECVTIWPFIEHQMAVALGMLLGSNTDASVAVFATLRSGRNQRDAIAAAAEAALDDRDQELIEAALSAFRTAEKIRNDVAHGNWGVCETIPDGLIWVETKHHAPWNAAVLGSPERELDPRHEQLKKHFYVYTEEDMGQSITTLKDVWRVAFDLVAYLRWKPGHPETREILYERLSQAPLVRESLDHQRTQKNTM